MNELEKKSFYSFLGLYIVSSFLFLALTAFWYYRAQKRAYENETFYTMVHVADQWAGEIIVAHMQDKALKPVHLPNDMTIALIGTDSKLKKGHLVAESLPLHKGYFTFGDYRVLVSDAPQEHLGIKYVVVQSDSLSKKIASLQREVTTVALGIALLVSMIAWMLSKLFIRPVHQRVVQIERFINDITHELNTPVTSLKMASEQAFKQGECTQKTLKNIAISTRQLYDIYRSLTYLNFAKREESKEVTDIEGVLQKSITYYRPLAEVKQIDFHMKTEPMLFHMPESQATLLFGNLIGNAIKYSPRGSSIEIELKEKMMRIKDNGIGIATEKQKEIFEKFKRGTNYSGGFGVGLNIVKSICDMYGIKITLVSALDKGTEFQLHFS